MKDKTIKKKYDFDKDKYICGCVITFETEDKTKLTASTITQDYSFSIYCVTNFSNGRYTQGGFKDAKQMDKRLKAMINKHFNLETSSIDRVMYKNKEDYDNKD